MNSAPLHNFHLPLPNQTYARLKKEAEREKRATTSVAREAIEEWLRQREKLAIREEIAVYAANMAGSVSDLDVELEKAAVEHLVESGKPSRKKR